MKQTAVLYLVIPCYNEEEALPETAKQLEQKMLSLMQKQLIHQNSRIVFVNDGSKDKTWKLIQQYHEENHLFQGVNLSRNKGHQNALLAGLMTVKTFCDVTISLDADLQDDIDAIDHMNIIPAVKLSTGSEIPVKRIRFSRKQLLKAIIT